MTTKKKILIAAIIAVLWVVAVVLSLGPVSRLFVNMYLAMMGALGIVTALVGIVDLLIRKRARVLYIGLAMLGFTATVSLATVGVVEYQYRQTCAQSDEIWYALHAYHDRHQEFPEHLGLLVPEYLDEIPKMKMGWHTEYFMYCKGSTEDNTFVGLSPRRYYYPMYVNWWLEDSLSAP